MKGKIATMMVVLATIGLLVGCAGLKSKVPGIQTGKSAVKKNIHKTHS